MRVVLLVVAVMALAGCELPAKPPNTSQQFASMIGSPIQTMMLRNGNPTNVFDMPGGGRAFQWEMSTTTSRPVYVDQTATLGRAPLTGGLGYNSQTTITGGSRTITCLFSLLTVWNEEQKTWIIVSYERPRPECERKPG